VTTNITTSPIAPQWAPLTEELNKLSGVGDPMLASALWFNCGVGFADRGLLPLARACYAQAFALNPLLWQAHANLAHVFEREGLSEQALGHYELALKHEFPVEGQIHLRNQYGRTLEAERRFGCAIKQYEKSLALKPDQSATRQHLIYLAQKICDWKTLARHLEFAQGSDQPVVGPLSAMALFDSVAELSAAIGSWVTDYRKKHAIQRLVIPKRYQHDRIRLGYVSGDFRMHAVGFLTAELYRSHDREQFEVYGYDFSKDDKSVFRGRLLADMDQVFDISALSDEQASKLIAAHEIDIVIDLMGFTANARPGIFMHKPAPIAISYLGFLGPCPIQEIDYILCDAYAVPKESAAHYGAKLLYVDFYQINNRQRPVLLASPPRARYGLPKDAFVYCALNNSYKITPSIFKRWMEILKKTPDSVLWILEENEHVAANLRACAKAFGIAPRRLIFSGPTQPDEYLARFACADLFLDTSPYNAGITATDALWAGLPVLTVPGNTFVSRMAADLLKQLGLEYLICKDLKDYVKKAVAFYRKIKPGKLLPLSKIHDAAVFDTPNFVEQYEALLKEISRPLMNRKSLQSPASVSSTKKELTFTKPQDVLKIQQIFYDPASRAHLDLGFFPLDNSYSKSPKLYELSAIRDYFSRYTLDDETWYGFFSPKFQLKTGLSSADVRKFFNQYKDQNDVMLFSPFWEQVSYFRNVFEQAEFWHPGIKAIAEKFFKKINYPIDLDDLVTCRRTSVFSNYFIAKGSFWREWLLLADQLISCLDKRQTALSKNLERPFPYGEKGKSVPAAVFLQERFATLLLSSNRYRCVTCDISDIPSPLFPEGFSQEIADGLRLCDTLKASYRQEPVVEYLESFYRLREAVFGDPATLRKTLSLS
jgi:predicted O-linked N-acetylglucosamine transferase (SPINDLY family)